MVINLKKFEKIDSLLKKNYGYLKTSDALNTGISKTYFGKYVRARELERVAHGLYMSADAWEDEMYVIQFRYPTAVFSHETALYLLGIAEREPLRYSVTMKTGTNATGLTKQNTEVYKIKKELLYVGAVEVKSPAGHTLNSYNAERTICDLARNRKNIDTQDLKIAIREYVNSKGKNIPLLMRYAKLFHVNKVVLQYLEAFL